MLTSMAEKAPTFEDIRTTIVLPYSMDRNLQVLSLTTDKSRNDLIKDALKLYLESHGLNPSAMPKIQITY